MRVLLVNTYDRRGGAARAALRLHKGLRRAGVDSLFAVQCREGDTEGVIGRGGYPGRLLSSLRARLDRLPLKRGAEGRGEGFSPGWLPLGGLPRLVRRVRPDLVHLHWVTDGLLRVEELADLDVPVVWSLHDMWPFTGGCHYSGDCARYRGRCGRCPLLGSDAERDLSRVGHDRKRIACRGVGDGRLVVVGLSRWIAGEAAGSTLFGEVPIRNLPNPIDTDRFCPESRAEARRRLGLGEEGPLLLFGAMNPAEDARKGAALLEEALRHLERSSRHRPALLIVGDTGGRPFPRFDWPLAWRGHVGGDEILRLLYAAADVTVVPSLQENLSNMIMESLACGTPVVAFDTGGNPDMIEHRANGYLARPRESADLATGIGWVLESVGSGGLSGCARRVVEERFSEAVVIPRYIELYRQVLAGEVAALPGEPK